MALPWWATHHDPLPKSVVEEMGPIREKPSLTLRRRVIKKILLHVPNPSAFKKHLPTTNLQISLFRKTVSEFIKYFYIYKISL